jgi:hypothetical protein
VLVQEGSDHLRSMSLQPIPDDDLQPAHLATEVLQMRDPWSKCFL